MPPPPPTITILLIGRKRSVLEDARQKLHAPNLVIHLSTDIDEVRGVFSKVAAEGKAIEHAFVGAGIDLDARLDVVREVYGLSRATTVHMKDLDSGVEGFVPFIAASLKGWRGDTLL